MMESCQLSDAPKALAGIASGQTKERIRKVYECNSADNICGEHKHAADISEKEERYKLRDNETNANEYNYELKNNNNSETIDFSVHKCCCEPYCTCHKMTHVAANSVNENITNDNANEHLLDIVKGQHNCHSEANKHEMHSSSSQNLRRQSNKSRLNKSCDYCESIDSIVHNAELIAKQDAVRQKRIHSTQGVNKNNVPSASQWSGHECNSKKIPLEKEYQHSQQKREQEKHCNYSKQCNYSRDNCYRRNASEILRLRRNQAYRRSLEHEYNVRLNTLQDELHARMRDLKKENETNAYLRCVNNGNSNKNQLYYKKLSNNGNDNSDTKYHEIVPERGRNSARTNIRLNEETNHLYNTHSGIHEHHHKTYIDNNNDVMNCKRFDNNNNKNYYYTKDYHHQRRQKQEQQQQEQESKSVVCTVIDSHEQPHCEALRCCPSCGSALVAINTCDALIKLNKCLFSSLSECMCCGFIGGTRATATTTIHHVRDRSSQLNNDKENNIEEALDAQEEVRTTAPAKFVQNGDAYKTDKDKMSSKLEQARKASVLQDKEQCENANSEERETVGTIAHTLPVFKTRSPRHAKYNNDNKKKKYNNKQQCKAITKKITSVTNSVKQLVTSNSPRFGRKTFITDEEYLYYRAQRLAAWEAEGCAERVNPPDYIANDIYTALPERTPR